MSFVLKSFLRKIPRDDFKAYLQDSFVSSDISKIKWGHKKQTDYLDSLIAFIQSEKKENQAKIQYDCETADFITKDHQGIQALNDSLLIHENNSEISEADSKEVRLAKALYIQSKQPHIIENAMHYYQSDRWYSGRNHSQFALKGGFEYKKDDSTQQELKNAITKIIQKSDILAKVHIDWVERKMDDTTIQQIVIYNENAPKGYNMFDDNNELETKFLRFVSEGCICFNPETGKIDIMGQGGKDRHKALRDAFQDIIMENPPEEKIEHIPSRMINIDMFKTKPKFEPYYGSVFSNISVQSLTINVFYNGRDSFGQITVNDKSEYQKNAYSLLKATMQKEDIAKTSWSISKVGLCCTIAETENEDEHSVSFELTFPNSSNLPSQHSRYQKDIENVLLKAGIYQNE